MSSVALNAPDPDPVCVGWAERIWASCTSSMHGVLGLADSPALDRPLRRFPDGHHLHDYAPKKGF